MSSDRSSNTLWGHRRDLYVRQDLELSLFPIRLELFVACVVARGALIFRDLRVLRLELGVDTGVIREVGSRGLWDPIRSAFNQVTSQDCGTMR